MARAGRSGTAYSLVAPDEMPYIFDLHLFLGRPLILAGAQEMPAGEGDPNVEVAAHISVFILGFCDLVSSFCAEGSCTFLEG